MRAIYEVYVTNDIYNVYFKDKDINTINKLQVARDILNNIIENDGYKVNNDLIFPMSLKDIDKILRNIIKEKKQ